MGSKSKDAFVVDGSEAARAEHVKGIVSLPVQAPQAEADAIERAMASITEAERHATQILTKQIAMLTAVAEDEGALGPVSARAHAERVVVDLLDAGLTVVRSGDWMGMNELLGQYEDADARAAMVAEFKAEESDRDLEALERLVDGRPDTDTVDLDYGFLRDLIARVKDLRHRYEVSDENATVWYEALVRHLEDQESAQS